MWKVLVLQLFFEIVLVKCVIPATLNVQKLDRKFIARKRQDTLEMCRIFNENNHKLEILNSGNSFNEHKRLKREVDVSDDGDRVEVLVDKMYDELAEKGEVVNYHKKPRTVKVARKAFPDSENALNNTARRFFFAPKIIKVKNDNQTKQIETEDTPTGPMPWPKRWKHGIVPYFIDPRTYDNELADTLMSAFAYIEKATCIRLQKLREKPVDSDSLTNVEWLYITNPSGIRQCVHSNEHKVNKGVQMVVFGYDCMSLGEIVHEIMHVLGFSHEHTRPDRDEHVSIYWDNIKPGYKKYFEVRNKDYLMNLPYDHASVLHYPPRAFSKNGKITVAAKAGVRIGQREGLSETDIEKIGVVYGFECVERNRKFLLETCPSTMIADNVLGPPFISHVDRKDEYHIKNYFKDRIWPYGIVNYRLRDKLEFTIEERENIAAVIRHIEKETCIEFRDVDADKNNDEELEVPEAGNDDEAAHETDIDNNEISNPALTEEAKERRSMKEDSNHDRLATTNEAAKPLNESSSIVASRKGTSFRRHANHILTFARSAQPGCRCPEPGRPDGDQVLEINHDCFNSVNDLLHFFVHLLGLDHQHNTHDRDDYIKVVWENVTSDIKADMEKKLPREASAGFTYDYQSVMHYPWLQIKDGITNIMYPVWNDGWAMGRWQGLSSTDIQKIEKIYMEQCQKRRDENGGDPIEVVKLF